MTHKRVQKQAEEDKRETVDTAQALKCMDLLGTSPGEIDIVRRLTDIVSLEESKTITHTSGIVLTSNGIMTPFRYEDVEQLDSQLWGIRAMPAALGRDTRLNRYTNNDKGFNRDTHMLYTHLQLGLDINWFATRFLMDAGLLDPGSHTEDPCDMQLQMTNLPRGPVAFIRAKSTIGTDTKVESLSVKAFLKAWPHLYKFQLPYQIMADSGEFIHHTQPLHLAVLGKGRRECEDLMTDVQDHDTIDPLVKIDRTHFATALYMCYRHLLYKYPSPPHEVTL
jgi:hypothetical protein